MKLIKLDSKQQRILYVLTFVAVGIGIFFLRSYLMLIILSAIMAVLFAPVNEYFLKRGKSAGKASFYTFMISLFVIIVPLIFVLIITGLQVHDIIANFNDQGYSVSVSDFGNDIVDLINQTLSFLGLSAQVSIQSFTQFVTDALDSVSTNLVDNILSAFSGFFSLITAAIIYIYVFLSMLKNKNKVQELIKKLNPLGDEVSDLYINRANAMTKATVRGQFIIALMQGGESAVVLALVGLESLFFFFLLLLTVMSVIPLGAGIITIPIGIVMILTGNVWQGVVVIMNHLLIVTNIDNVMRPKLVPKSARLDPALMILAVFSGIALFGFLGIVIGPIVMILIITTLQIYNEVFFNEASIDRNKYAKSEGSLKKISGLAKKTTSRATSKVTGILDK